MRRCSSFSWFCWLCGFISFFLVVCNLSPILVDAGRRWCSLTLLLLPFHSRTLDPADHIHYTQTRRPFEQNRNDTLLKVSERDLRPNTMKSDITTTEDAFPDRPHLTAGLRPRRVSLRLHRSNPLRHVVSTDGQWFRKLAVNSPLSHLLESRKSQATVLTTTYNRGLCAYTGAIPLVSPEIQIYNFLLLGHRDASYTAPGGSLSIEVDPRCPVQRGTSPKLIEQTAFPSPSLPFPPFPQLLSSLLSILTHRFSRHLQISLIYTILHLALLHFRIIPSYPLHPARPPSTTSLSTKPTSTIKPKPNLPTPLSTTTLLLLSLLFTLFWLTLSIIATSCELAPILSGSQGTVPQWCPQSNFRGLAPGPTTATDRADMLASLALAKDCFNWVIFVAGIGMVECCRRGKVRCAREEGERLRGEVEVGLGGLGGGRGYDPGVRRWGGGGDGGAGGGYGQVGEAEWVSGGKGGVGGGGGVRVGVTDIGWAAPPKPNFAIDDEQGEKQKKKNSWFGIRSGEDVRVNLKVPGVSYDTRY